MLTVSTAIALSATLFLFLVNPLSMTALLIILTVLSCLLINLTVAKAWLPFMLFLIYVGGMMVLFIYITSLTANSLFLFNKKTLILLTSLILTGCSTPIFFSSTKSSTIFSPSEAPILKIFSSSSIIPMPSIMMYLLIILFLVTIITSLNQAPLRLLSSYA
uniref:NADH-ubiquinone oxidoreductase chain 6 n=1 Tax=Megalothorax incertus TaxID=2579793 RepID=A0A8E8GTT6_9HEXA|nr:NADH dehydrogenase subunit 6 [Megalothorax incertus]